MTLDELIERLEGASEGSRGLDGLIAAKVLGWHFTGCSDEHLEHWEKIAGRWIEPEVMALPLRERMAYVDDTPEPPLFTESIDSAISLVPEGARIRELGQWWDIDKPGGWFCNIMRWEYDETQNLIERCYTFGFAEDDRMPKTAPTGALALCIAALRARRTTLAGGG